MGQSNEQTPQPTDQPESNAKDSRSGTSSHEDEDFVDINSADIDMQDADNHRQPSQSLDLHRFGNHIDDVDEVDDDDDDDSDDEHPMASHPLLNMLTGRLGRRRGSTHKWDRLHPENQALSVLNVDQCTKLEEAAFPPEERATREKFQYRLTRCPELTLGLFTQPTKAEAEESQSVPERKLMGHIISTRTPAPSVTDESMAIPENWKTRRSSLPGQDEKPLGHQDQGGTICIHSLAVAPEYQKMGLGTILMKSYIQRIKDSKSAERLALLAHDNLVPFYSMFGFENMGKSDVSFGGGNWNNMVLTFTHDDDE